MKQPPISALHAAMDSLRFSGVEIKKIEMDQRSFAALISTDEYRGMVTLLRYSKDYTELGIANSIFESIGLPKIVILKDNGQ